MLFVDATIQEVLFVDATIQEVLFVDATIQEVLFVDATVYRKCCLLMRLYTCIHVHLSLLPSASLNAVG